MSVTIQVTRDAATPAIAKMLGKLTPQRLGAAVGPACSLLVKQNFRGLGTNKRGWPTTNFWARAAKATSWSREPDGVMVSVNQIGVRQRWLGGVIRPVTARALTIPMSPVAYGHRASEFPGLFLLKTKTGTFLAQHGEDVGGKRTKAARASFAKGLKGNVKVRINAFLNILFKLESSVTQEADASVMPAREEFAATARQAIVEAIAGKGAGSEQ